MSHFSARSGWARICVSRRVRRLYVRSKTRLAAEAGFLAGSRPGASWSLPTTISPPRGAAAAVGAAAVVGLAAGAVVGAAAAAVVGAAVGLLAAAGAVVAVGGASGARAHATTRANNSPLKAGSN